MSWLAKDEDDWLSEPSKPADSKPVNVHSDESNQFAPVDLTSVAETMEPLHTLPEAPSCAIRMFQFTLIAVFF